MYRDIMDTQQVPASIWQQMIQQNFLSLYDLTPDKITDPEYLQGYDFVFEFSNAVVYLIVNDVTIQADRQDIDSTQVRTWRKDVVNQLIKQHAQLYLKNDKALAYKDESINKSKNESASDTTADKAIYFIGLTALSIQHQDIAEKTALRVLITIAIKTVIVIVTRVSLQRRSLMRLAMNMAVSFLRKTVC